MLFCKSCSLLVSTCTQTHRRVPLVQITEVWIGWEWNVLCHFLFIGITVNESLKKWRKAGAGLCFCGEKIVKTCLLLKLEIIKVGGKRKLCWSEEDITRVIHSVFLITCLFCVLIRVLFKCVWGVCLFLQLSVECVTVYVRRPACDLWRRSPRLCSFVWCVFV